MIYTVRIPFENYSVGLDMLAGTSWRIAGVQRTIGGIAFTGGLVDGDSEIELFLGDMRAGVMYASSQFAPQPLRDRWPTNRIVAAGDPIVANIQQFPVNAGSGSLYLALDLR